MLDEGHMSRIAHLLRLSPVSNKTVLVAEGLSSQSRIHLELMGVEGLLSDSKVTNGSLRQGTSEFLLSNTQSVGHFYPQTLF